MQTLNSPARMLADQILDTLDRLVREAETAAKPLEVEPYRDRLFELFVTAHGAGFLREGAAVELSADVLCRELGQRWGLSDALRGAEAPTPGPGLDARHVGKLRLLWSLMRLWMEWTYAWSRWPEFHKEAEA
jgi:hypothetical protein